MQEPVKVSAYIPCFNNEQSIVGTIQSIMAQNHPVAELLVIDDGSSDRSAEIAGQAGARVIRLDKNSGRGPARARAMREAEGEFVLCVDGTNVISPDFLATAMPWFSDPSVSAVWAPFSPGRIESLADRWRARHLFLAERERSVGRGMHLSTSAAIVRRSAVLQVGNYNEALRHTEDGELGVRLRNQGFDVICDPALRVSPSFSNPLMKVLERHWRWYVGADERISWIGYAKAVVYSAKVMARDDLRRGDWACAVVSLFSPHHHFWKTVSRRIFSCC